MSAPIPFLDLGSLYRQDAALYDAAYHRVMGSGRWVLGDELAAFEREFADYCECGHAVGVGNGLDALSLVLSVAGIGPGDEVIVPAHTFIATWLAVVRVGATPVPVELKDGSYVIDSSGVADAITPRTRAVIPVHLYGQPADISAIAQLCDQKGLLLIEDAAQAHGARAGGRRIGSFGRMACFSFYPGKNLGAFGDGGAVTTSDGELASALRAWRNYGSLKRYEHESLGVNSRLDELQAAFLRVRLARLDEHNRIRRQLAEAYLERLGGEDRLGLPRLNPAEDPVWHLFVIRVGERDALQAWLRDRGIESLIHYPRPVYRFPPFQQFAPSAESSSDRLCEQILSLPMGPHLVPEDVHRVCDAVFGFLDQQA